MKSTQVPFTSACCGIEARERDNIGSSRGPLLRRPGSSGIGVRRLLLPSAPALVVIFAGDNRHRAFPVGKDLARRTRPGVDLSRGFSFLMRAFPLTYRGNNFLWGIARTPDIEPHDRPLLLVGQ